MEHLLTMLLVLDTKQNTVLELIRIEYMGHSNKPRNVDRAMFDAFAGFLTDILSSKGVAAGDIASWKGALNTAIYSV